MQTKPCEIKKTPHHTKPKAKKTLELDYRFLNSGKLIFPGQSEGVLSIYT